MSKLDGTPGLFAGEPGSPELALDGRELEELVDELDDTVDAVPVTVAVDAYIIWTY